MIEPNLKKFNEFILELSPLLLLEGIFENNIGQSFRFRKFDGIHYDIGGQKEIARIIINQLESSEFIRIFKE